MEYIDGGLDIMSVRVSVWGCCKFAVGVA